MRIRFWGIATAALAGLWLAACATPPPYHPERSMIEGPRPSIATPPAAGPRQVDEWDFAQLDGWAEDDHASALAALQTSCRSSRSPALAGVCRRARQAGQLDDAAARRFLETNFRPMPIAGAGLLTAYFSPLYAARAERDAEFSAPVRPRPADLASSGPVSERAYADRAAIDALPAGDALAWMRPEDLFFLQIQGSGVLVFPDGSRAKALFDGTNGAPFVAIASPMVRMGLMSAGGVSAGGIRRWLADNRGQAAQAVMALDPRYVFFRLAPDDGSDPSGAAGAALIAGRSVAIDPTEHALGEIFWIDASGPSLAGASPAYRRLVVAMDTGGAIKGAARADLYLGRGDAAGEEAGRVRHLLRMWRLDPVDGSGR
jgi:membrane-bound lytic murein transglycosylase A